jgi:uncharacterized membrane protein
MGRLLQDRDGSVLPMVGLMLASLILIAGAVFDLAHIWHVRRQLQATADVAAMHAASANSLTAADALAAAQAVFSQNGFADATVSVTLGTYTPDATIAVADRFVAQSEGTANAVLVSAQETIRVYFLSLVTGSPTVTPKAVEATAFYQKEAALTAGTTLAALSGGVVNAVLGALLGNANLNLVSYTGLASTSINLLQLSDAIATRLNLTAGTYSQVLTNRVSLGTLLDAAVSVLGTASAAGQELLSLVAQIDPTVEITLSDLLDLGTWDTQSVGAGQSAAAVHATVNVLQLVSLAAQVANGQHAVSVPLSIDIPGLASLNLALWVGEAAQTAPLIGLGPVGTTVHTAQVRLLLQLSLLSTGIPGASSVIDLPLYLELASGTATVAAVSCGTDPATDGTVTVSAQSIVASLAIGDVNTSNLATVSASSLSPATIINLFGLVSVRAWTSSPVTTSIGDATSLVFTQTDIANQTAHSTVAGISLAGLLSGLASNLQLDFGGALGPLLNLLGLNDTVLALIAAVITPVLSLLDPVINAILTALGLQLGVIDVTVGGMRCGVAALVQ